MALIGGVGRRLRRKRRHDLSQEGPAYAASLLMGQDWGMLCLLPGWGFADDFIPDAQLESAPFAPMRMEAIEALADAAEEFRSRNIGMRIYQAGGTGGTIGLTLLGWKSGKDLDMAVPANRALLRDVMLRHGFTPNDAERWHFTGAVGEDGGDFPILPREFVLR